MTGEDTPVQALPILFVFVEDGTLFIAEDLAAVRRECEPIDVESGVYTFYDGAGRPLMPRFTTPNRQTRLFGLISTVEPGEFVLEPGSEAECDPIDIALLETEHVTSNPYFHDLSEVRRYLRAVGALP